MRSPALSSLVLTRLARSLHRCGSSMRVIEHNNEFLHSALSGERANTYGLVVLNSEDTAGGDEHGALLARLWSSMSYVICADGGANRLYDWVSPAERWRFVPHVIAGDLDSIRPEVRQQYR